MKERRGAEFGDAVRRQGAVAVQDAGEDAMMRGKDGLLVGLGEVAALGFEFAQFGIAGEGGVAAPGQVEPDLEVEIILAGKGGRQGVQRQVAEIVAAAGQQFVVTGMRTDEVVPVGLEEVFEEIALVLGAQLGGGEAGPRLPKIADFAGGQLADLPDENGGEVEDHPGFGMAAGHFGHVQVALHRVQPHPGHHRRLRQGVDVVRLVHVPDQRDVQHGGLWMGAGWTTRTGTGKRSFSSSSR